MNTPFNNIRKAIVKENNLQMKKQLNLKEIKNTDLSNLGWFYQQFLTPAVKRKGFATVKDFKEFLTDRIKKDFAKRLIKELARLEVIENTEIPEVINLQIEVEWKKNRTWGANPTATCYVPGLGNISSGSIGGCGYDKQSTAVANILNQCNFLLKMLYAEKNKAKNINKKNSEIFGYGSGYYILPQIEGGVGVSCYPQIFEKIGLKFETVVNSDNFDCYTVKSKVICKK